MGKSVDRSLIASLDKVKLINRVRGLVPTFDTFDTNPSSPERMTDGDFESETGEGVKSGSASYFTIGNIKFNMGIVVPVVVLARVNMHRDSGDGTVVIYLADSPDGVSYNAHEQALNTSGRYQDTYGPLLVGFAYGKAFKLRPVTSSVTVASVFHVKVAEVQAWQIL